MGASGSSARAGAARGSTVVHALWNGFSAGGVGGVCVVALSDRRLEPAQRPSLEDPVASKRWVGGVSIVCVWSVNEESRLRGEGGSVGELDCVRVECGDPAGGEIGRRQVDKERGGETGAVMHPPVVNVDVDGAVVALLGARDVRDDGVGDIAHCGRYVCDTGNPAVQGLYTVGTEVSPRYLF